MNNPKVVKHCFILGLFFLQFEDFQVVGEISVFLGCILPICLLGLLNIKQPADALCKKLQAYFIFLLLVLCFFNLLHGDSRGVFNKLLLIPFCLFFLYSFCNHSIRAVRYDYIFLITTLINIASLIFGFGTYKDMGLRFCGIYKDPNFLCVTVLMALYSKLIYLNALPKASKLIYIVLLLLDGFLVFSSGSRGGLIVALFMISAYLYININSKLLKNTILVCGFIGVLSVWQYAQTLTMWGGYYDNPIDQVLSRFSSEKMEDGSHRTALWENALDYMNDNGNLIFPVGYENLKTHLAKTDTVGFSHNSYIDFASDAGYILAIIVLLFLLNKVIFVCKTFLSKKNIGEAIKFMIIVSFSNMLLYFFLSAYGIKLFWINFIMLMGVYHEFKLNKNLS